MTVKDQKLSLLAGVPLFSELGSKELRRVGELADVVDRPAGRVLMRQGEHGSEAMVIVDGHASIERDGEVINESGPGAVVGEMAMISSRPRTATVTLTTDATLLVIGRREFTALMEEMPSVRHQIMECLAWRLMAAEQNAAH